MRVPQSIEVFADVSCPFTHLGLKIVSAEVASVDAAIDVRVRAWPLEWVNGSPLDASAVAEKIRALEKQLGVSDFRGFRADRWPQTTIPALNLAAAAYRVDASTGLAVSLKMRSLLFEEGEDIASSETLAGVARSHGLPAPPTTPVNSVTADYDDGQRRGVRGSPDFWVGDNEFFCPSLDLGHDSHGALTASFDTDGLRQLVASVARRP